MNGRLLIVTWLLLAPLAFSQKELSAGPCPDSSGASLGCELIVWSQLQRPAPLPDAESLANPDPADQPPGESAHDGQLLSVTLVGTITSNAGSSFLAVADTALAVRNEIVVRQFTGKKVCISGLLDSRGKTLHVLRIEPVSETAKHPEAFIASPFKSEHP